MEKNLSQTNGFRWFLMIFFLWPLHQTLQNPLLLEEKTIKIIGFYKVFRISMLPTTTNVDTYYGFWREKIMLTRTRICDEKNLSKTNGFWWLLMDFFFWPLQQTLQNPMFFEEKTLKIIGFYKVFCIAMMCRWSIHDLAVFRGAPFSNIRCTATCDQIKRECL